MRRIATLLCLLSALTVLSLGCAKPAPVRMTAQQYFDAGLKAYNQENFSQAAGQFEQASAASPSLQEAFYYLGLSYWKLNMADKAKAAFINVLNLNPSHLYAHESLAMIFYREGNYPEAQRQLEAARGLNSINPEVFLALGNIYGKQSRCPEAQEAYQRGLAVDSANLALQKALAEAKRNCGKPGPAPKGKAVRAKKSRVKVVTPVPQPSEF
jgi:tetratricopeptide (TPR) repeat protein